VLLVFAAGLSGCVKDTNHQVVVSTVDQKMTLLEKGVPLGTYEVSTSKFGLGDVPNSFRTPVGRLEVEKKIGEGAPMGTVFKNREPTGEILAVDAPGRDPIVTRIIWLKGTDSNTANAFERTIYIHGTPEERNLGKPASYGCVRMRSADIAYVYAKVGWGAEVLILDVPLDRAVRYAQFKKATL
jgi:L,D-transpeptidase catalytic domain